MVRLHTVVQQSLQQRYNMKYQVYHSDCVAFMRTLPSNHVDAIVTDPPYELGFMGKGWDKSGIANSVEMWSEALRILKPGGHLLAFSGSRTYHRMTCAIEDAGFEIRDQIMWVYGSGFPKSLDVSKAIDKAAGAEREILGIDPVRFARLKNQVAGSVSTGEQWEHGGRDVTITAPATDAAKQWQGWGTALKPAHEPICVARKPLEGTVAHNVMTWGTGGLNVDGCRVEYASDSDKEHALAGDAFKRKSTKDKGWSRPWMENAEKIQQMNREAKERAQQGRWPSNFVHDGSEEATELLGDAQRFFYCAKTSKRDRDQGCEGIKAKRCSDGRKSGLSSGMPDKALAPSANHHPTVKPTDLMRYLCRLVTPPSGLIFDPFTGSGSTGKAAVLEGFDFLGCDITAEYVDIARARIEHAAKSKHNSLFQ